MSKLNFHNYFLNQIKKSSKLSFIAFEKRGVTYGIKAVKDGIKKFIPLQGTPEDVTPQSYQTLANFMARFDFKSEQHEY